MIKNKEYDLAILDGGLSGMSGFEICQEVKKVSTLPIILSDRRKDKDVVKRYRNGADDYIIMPFIIDELGERVKARINMHESLLWLKPRSYDIIGKRNIKIDPMSRRVWINNEEIFPRSKEFALLLFFVNNPNRALSREERHEKEKKRKKWIFSKNTSAQNRSYFYKIITQKSEGGNFFILESFLFIFQEEGIRLHNCLNQNTF